MGHEPFQGDLSCLSPRGSEGAYAGDRDEMVGRRRREEEAVGRRVRDVEAVGTARVDKGGGIPIVRESLGRASGIHHDELGRSRRFFLEPDVAGDVELELIRGDPRHLLKT